MSNKPETPLITEPEIDGKLVNFADVHIETDFFQDPDPGDFHLYSDFEIWNVEENQPIWEAKEITGLEKTHIHLGDGIFLNSHIGLTELLPDEEYLLRVRFSDNNNDLSFWAERNFLTSSLSSIFSLNIEDILDHPQPSWTNSISGEPIIFPDGNQDPSLAIKSIEDDFLLQIEPKDGQENEVTNYPPIPHHEDVKVEINAGNSSLTLPQSQISFTTDENEEKTVYLPSISLETGETENFWISTNGSTYEAEPTDEQPDFSDLAQGTLNPWKVLQPGYKVELVATGFQLPVNIAFNPNLTDDPEVPLFYVTELYGNIKVVTNDGSVSDYATDILNFNPSGNFPGSGEIGLVGLAIDPISGDLFASLLYADGFLYPRIIRFQSSEDGLRAVNQTTILDLEGVSMGAAHQISNLTIGGDSKMYVHLADGYQVDQVQNLEDFRGKILRINLDGTPAIDNPFYDESDGITAKDYVYAYGFRNPFGGDWRYGDNSLYKVGNGPGNNDRLAKVSAGENYGWDGTDESMTTNALYNWDAPHAPVNLSFIQPEIFNGSGFHKEKWGNAFVTESGPTYATGPQEKGKRIVEFALDDQGNLLNSEPVTLVEYDGVGKGTAVALAAGSDGLYFSDFYQDLDYNSPIDAGASIYRIYYEETYERRPSTDIYRFQNPNFPGTYLFAGGEERDLINANYANDFTEEGFAFKVGVNPEEDDNLIPIYRFQNNHLPGTYLFVNEGEKNLINTNYADDFTEEGLAFYVYGADSDQGDPFYRFQNTNLPGSYIFVNEEERNFIKANYPSFVEEGRAFNVLT